MTTMIKQRIIHCKLYIIHIKLLKYKDNMQIYAIIIIQVNVKRNYTVNYIKTSISAALKKKSLPVK